MARPKIALVGAGNIGGTLAHLADSRRCEPGGWAQNRPDTNIKPTADDASWRHLAEQAHDAALARSAKALLVLPMVWPPSSGSTPRRVPHRFEG